MPSRRSLLGSLGVLLTAGCSQLPTVREGPGESDSAASDPSTDDPVHVPTRLEWGAPATYDGATVAPQEALNQHSVFTLTTPDSYGVVSVEGHQFLFVTIGVRGDGEAPEPANFTVETSGERYSGWTTYEDLRENGVRLDIDAPPYDPADAPTGGWIGFALPASIEDDEGQLRLQFPGEYDGATHWPLPESVQQSLTVPAPDLRLDSVGTPESVESDEAFDVDLTVVNDGSRDGTVRIAVNEASPQHLPHPVRVSLEAGATQTKRVTIDSHVGIETDSVRVRVLTEARAVERTIDVE